MITRRSVSFAAAAMVLGARQVRAALPVPAGNVLNARVLRKGDEIGTAKYRFEREGNVLRVHIAVDLVVKLGPIPVFRYTHRNVETWQEDTLISLDGKTDDDGTAKFCRAERGPDGLMVKGSRTEPYVAPPQALGTTYWDFRTVSSPLINTEDGRLISAKMVPGGAKTVTVGTGADIPAREYDLRGDFNVDIFYDATNQWAALNYYARDKSVVIYQRL